MALPTAFSNNANPTGPELDGDLQALGALTTVQCTAVGTNGITLTPQVNAPAVTAYGLPYPLKFGFVAVATSTGSVTLQVGALALLPLYLASGAQAGSGNIQSGFYYEVVYTAAATYNSGNGAFIITSTLPSTGATPLALGGTRGLLIVNNGVTPATKINITANQAVMVTTAGVPFFASAVSVTCDLTTNGANGMDTGSRPANGWVYLYLISNGLTTASLASATSPTAGNPTLPSGYTYFNYVGAMVLASSSLLNTRQQGDVAIYIVGSSPANSLVMANGIAGTYSLTTPTLATITITSYVPLTAGVINVAVTNCWKGGTNSNVIVAGNANYGGANNGAGGTNGNIFIFSLNDASTIGAFGGAFAAIELEGTTIAWTSSAAGAAVACIGWKDYYSR